MTSWETNIREIVSAARCVVDNAQGTKPRHTKARDNGCRDDCIPCGLAALKAVLDLYPYDQGSVTHNEPH